MVLLLQVVEQCSETRMKEGLKETGKELGLRLRRYWGVCEASPPYQARGRLAGSKADKPAAEKGMAFL